MFTWTHWLVPVAVVGVALMLVRWHGVVWRTTLEDSTLDTAERSFRQRQYRRRTQASALLLVLAVGMGLGLALEPLAYPNAYVAVWCGVALLALWAMLLACGDLWASRMHLERLVTQRNAARLALEAELRRAQGLAASRRVAACQGDSSAGPAPTNV